MERININKIDGLSAFKLSHIVASLEFIRPNTRGQHRPDKVKKAVLRALCDRYPNVWPGIEDIARKASCGTTQTRRALRELEHKDRLIVDVNSRPAWACWTGCWYCVPNPRLNLEAAGKKGGRGKNCTVQYFIMDRKILDIYEQAKWFEKNAPIENQKPNSLRVETQRYQDSGAGVKPNGMRIETQRSESQKPTVSESEGGQNPTVAVAEPIRFLTEKGTDKPNAVSSQENGDALLRLPNSGKKTLEENVQAKIDEQDGTFAAYVEWSEKRNFGHPFDADTQKAFAAMEYKPDLNSRRLTRDFVTCAVDVYEAHCDDGMAPTLLCTKVIDECLKRQAAESNGCYFWPPDFQAHRNRLRAPGREQAVAANT
jgi:hypothetical protein